MPLLWRTRSLRLLALFGAARVQMNITIICTIAIARPIQNETAHV